MVAFGIRLSAALSFFLLEKPDSKFAGFIMIVLIVSNYAEHIVTNSFFTKRIPGDVRGSYRGIVNAIALMFAFVFQIVSYKLVMNGYSASTPLIIIAVLDGVVVYVCFFIGVLQLNPELNIVNMVDEHSLDEKKRKNQVLNFENSSSSIIE